MGSKGSQLKESKNTQSQYTANPYIQQAGGQALGLAGAYANRPFETPIAPVAGMTPDQLGAFAQIEQMQGMVNPYFDQARMFANQSASPINPSEVSNYLNPFAGYALSGLNDTIGSQNRDIHGNLVRAAGGTGADRVAVGQAEKFRQDQLARGELMSRFYQPALAAAQQDRGRQGAAASLFGYLGPAHQTSLLQGTGALLGAGGQQQQQRQAELNAPYQNILAQIADPAQKAQFLASITGGLAPAFGGSQTGESQTYGPKPSMLSQVAGLGATALGAYMGVPISPNIFSGGASGKGGSGGGGYYGGSPETNPMLNPASYGNLYAARGGRVNPFAFGGPVGPEDALQGYDDGGDVRFNPTSAPDYIPTFGDRFSAASDPYPSELPENQVPLPRPRPQNPFSWLKPQGDEGVYAPEPAPRYGEDDGGTPGIRRPGPGPAMRSPGPPSMGPLPDTSYEPGISERMAASPWLALAYAGAKTAAGQSPNALTNIGEGAAGGIEMLGKQQTAAMQNRRVDLEAKRLMEQALQHREQIAETGRQHRETIGLGRERLGETARQHDIAEARARREQELKELQPFKIGVDPTTGYDVYGVRDPKSKKIITLDPRTGEPRAAASAQAETDTANTGQQFLESLPKDQQDFLKKVNDGDINPASLPARRRELVLRQAAQAFPGFDQTIWKSRNETRAAFAKGVEGRAVTSLNTVMGHAWDFKETASKLAQKNVKPWNRIENAIKDNFGNDALADYRLTRTALADELARVFQGAGVAAESEKQRWLDSLDDAKTPGQFKRILGRLPSLLKSRMNALENQHDRGMGYDPDNPRAAVNKGFLDPEPRKKYEELIKWSQEPAPEPRRRGAPSAPAPKSAIPKIAPEVRFKQLIDSGTPEADAYETMKREGYGG